jgi:hypothetical protein
MSRRIWHRHPAGGVPPAVLRALAGLALLGWAFGAATRPLAGADLPPLHVPEPNPTLAIQSPPARAEPFAAAESFGAEAPADPGLWAAELPPNGCIGNPTGGNFRSAGGLLGPGAGADHPGPLRRLGRWFHPHGHPPPSPRGTWLSRPFGFEWMLGAVWGGSLIDDWLEQGHGMFGALRIGWDADPYWGLKMRFALAETSLVDSPRAIQAQQERDAGGGITEDNLWYWRFHRRRHVDMFLWDVSFVYYPLGDTRLRPYLTIGVGTVRMSFVDRLDREFAEISLGMPVGFGLKYRCNDWLAVLCEFTDNVAFTGGKGLNTMHELSLVGGMEIRFGGSRRSYWPWNPSRYSW